jgi:hypothetical protein
MNEIELKNIVKKIQKCSGVISNFRSETQATERLFNTPSSPNQKYYVSDK